MSFNSTNVPYEVEINNVILKDFVEIMFEDRRWLGFLVYGVFEFVRCVCLVRISLVRLWWSSASMVKTAKANTVTSISNTKKTLNM